MCRGVELVSYLHQGPALCQPRRGHLWEVTRPVVGEEDRSNVAGDGEAAGEASGADTSHRNPASASVYVDNVILHKVYAINHRKKSLVTTNLVFRGWPESRECAN